MLGLHAYDILIMKVKCYRNKATLDVISGSIRVIIDLEPKRAVASLDIMSLGYHKTWQGVSQQSLIK